MEILYIILGLIIGAVLVYFILKSSSVSRKNYEVLNQNLAKLNAEKDFQKKEIENQKEINLLLNSEIKELQNEINSHIATKSELAAKNDNLQKLLDSQKEEIIKMQQEAKLQFENLANKILDEKTQKFTEQN